MSAEVKFAESVVEGFKIINENNEKLIIAEEKLMRAEEKLMRAEEKFIESVCKAFKLIFGNQNLIVAVLMNMNERIEKLEARDNST